MLFLVIISCSKSCKTIFASIGDKGEPMGKPKICLKIFFFVKDEKCGINNDCDCPDELLQRNRSLASNKFPSTLNTFYN